MLRMIALCAAMLVVTVAINVKMDTAMITREDDFLGKNCREYVDVKNGVSKADCEKCVSSSGGGFFSRKPVSICVSLFWF